MNAPDAPLDEPDQRIEAAGIRPATRMFVGSGERNVAVLSLRKTAALRVTPAELLTESAAGPG